MRLILPQNQKRETSVRRRQAKKDFHWLLGRGFYGRPEDNETDPAVLLEYARYDWLIVKNIKTCEAVDTINRLLAINPEQKYMLELWPLAGLGLPKNRSAAMLFDYLYNTVDKDGVKHPVKDEVLARLRQEIRNALTISKPENIIACTFFEEIQGQWGYSHHINNDGVIFHDLDHYREEILAERGETELVFDASMRAFIGEKFVETLREIHTTIRQEAGGRLVLFWPLPPIVPDEIGNPNTDPSKRKTYPFTYSDVIEPGTLTDGLMLNTGYRDEKFSKNVYPLWNIHLQLAESNGWAFFGQLSHPTTIRSGNWDTVLSHAETNSPCNLGYFLFDNGSCKRPHKAWDDERLPDVHSIRGRAIQIHMRAFARQVNVGTAVYGAQTVFRPQLHVEAASGGVGAIVDLYAVVTNPKQVGFDGFLPEQSGTANAADVVATLALPPGLSTNDPLAVSLATLSPSNARSPVRTSMAIAHWQLTVEKVGAVSQETPLRVSVTSTNTGSGDAVLTSMADHTLPALQPHQLWVSGEAWVEPGFQLPADLQPVIVMDTLDLEVPEPSITTGDFNTSVDLGLSQDNGGYYERLPTTPLSTPADRIVVRRTLPPHHRLVIQPDMTATLEPRPTAEVTFTDDLDPTSHKKGKKYTEGYSVRRVSIGSPIDPATQSVRVSIGGKVDGGVQSLVVVLFVDKSGNRFSSNIPHQLTTKWQDNVSSKEIIPPPEATKISMVLLYRTPNGLPNGPKAPAIWYSHLTVDVSPTPWFSKRYRDAGDHNTETPETIEENIDQELDEGVRLRVVISGKVEGAINTLVQIDFENRDNLGEIFSVQTLADQFTTEWQNQISAEVTPPFSRSVVKAVHLLSRSTESAANKPGTIWYGHLALASVGTAVLTADASPAPWFSKRYRDAGDRTGYGYKWYDKGYNVRTENVDQELEAGARLRVVISGRVESAINTLVQIDFENRDNLGEISSVSTLADQFTTEWQNRISAEVTPPFARSVVKTVRLYRSPESAANKPGIIWYGHYGHLALASVGTVMVGVMPTLKKNVNNILTYHDTDTIQPDKPKVKIQLHQTWP